MKYLYLEKPAYDQEKETISPDYKIENGVFIVNWKIRKKPDEDGYTQTVEENAELEKLATEMPRPSLRPRNVSRRLSRTMPSCEMRWKHCLQG